jgi:hypothetical protein
MTLNIETVWQKTTPALRQEITDFWEANRMLPAGTDAGERATQAVQIVRSPEGAIVGLTTADVVQFKQLNNNVFYLFRMSVLPQFRAPGIESKLIVDTRDVLEAYASKATVNKCIGMLTFVENPQVIAYRTWAVWPASKMVYIGSDSKGRHIRVYYFKGAKI